jgi:hypothetical protein
MESASGKPLPRRVLTLASARAGEEGQVGEALA